MGEVNDRLRNSLRLLGVWFNISFTEDLGTTYHDHNKLLTWPILAFYDEPTARTWERKLRAFARTITAEREHDYYGATVNGDRRLASWLAENGFERYNHIWWQLKGNSLNRTEEAQ